MSVGQITSFGNDFRQVTRSISNNWQAATTDQMRRTAGPGIFNKNMLSRNIDKVFEKAMNPNTGAALRQQGVIS